MNGTDGTLKTRERLLAEHKTELETHAGLKEQHLFPVLRKHAEIKDLVAAAVKDNRELRAQVAELDTLPKNDETFLTKLSELRRAFRQHARDEAKELLPAVQKALSEEQVIPLAEKVLTVGARKVSSGTARSLSEREPDQAYEFEPVHLRRGRPVPRGRLGPARAGVARRGPGGHPG